MADLMVHGRKASLNEYNVAMAADKLGLEYYFQYTYNGGRDVRGGIVLDFLFFTVPMKTPVQVHGEYWHQGASEAEDRLKELALLKNADWFPPVTIWGEESGTVEDALIALKRELFV